MTGSGIKKKKKVSRRSPLRYPGGKQRAIKAIAKYFPRQAREYREPMVGGGSVYFHLRNRNFAEHYWINDKFCDLIDFWRVCQEPDGCRRLQEELFALKARLKDSEGMKEFFLQVKDKAVEDPFERALLFFFFNRVTFSGTTRAGGFSSQASKDRFTDTSIERLDEMPRMLEGTKISNLDVYEVLQAPGDDVFIFLDPPYYQAGKLYGKGGALHDFDHERLAGTLKASEHRFLITYDDCQAIRDLYGWATLKSWDLQYGMNNCNRDKTSKVGKELMIYNYSAPDA